MNIEIATAAEEHIEKVLSIGEESGLSVWSREAYNSELSRPESVFLVATGADNRCIGFVIGRLVPDTFVDSMAAEIYNIGVQRAHRRTHIGSRLIRSFTDLVAKNGATKVFLEVRTGNLTAIEFYKKHGFEIYSTRRAFYSGPQEDATLMRAII